MASVFQRKSRSVWTANIRVWNAEKGGWDWRQISTGVTDENAALAIATAMENASGEARAGLMTRPKAEALVNSILQLAGVSWSAALPSLEDFAGPFIEARAAKLEGSTGRKYRAHWKRLSEWAGPRLKWPLDRWTPAVLGDYYSDLQSALSATTANNHMVTLSMVFLRAVASGHLRGNPVDLVERAHNDSEEKLPLSREETAKLLRGMRRKSRHWTCLTLLGWHTGHRLQDLLSLNEGCLSERKGVGWTVAITPAKKQRRGGRVVILPLPRYVAMMFRRVKNFTAIFNADNRNGRVSQAFIDWMIGVGIDPLPVARGARTITRKSFHSFRHSMSSRLTAAGVTGELARLVTDHDSERVHSAYVHAEVTALAEALKKARRR